mmetsp:Transcript_83680/g.159765  ORF Transcript_83680/g.159765 Transcript_83680/m.159765 type:complete len:440 (+) Transcript_83680:96-1415(+)
MPLQRNAQADQYLDGGIAVTSSKRKIIDVPKAGKDAAQNQEHYPDSNSEPEPEDSETSDFDEDFLREESTRGTLTPDSSSSAAEDVIKIEASSSSSPFSTSSVSSSSSGESGSSSDSSSDTDSSASEADVYEAVNGSTEESKESFLMLPLFSPESWPLQPITEDEAEEWQSTFGSFGSAAELADDLETNALVRRLAIGLRQKRAVLSLQKVERGRQAICEDAAVTLQAWTRGRQQRVRFQETLKAIVCVQRWFHKCWLDKAWMEDSVPTECPAREISDYCFEGKSKHSNKIPPREVLLRESSGMHCLPLTSKRGFEWKHASLKEKRDLPLEDDANSEILGEQMLMSSFETDRKEILTSEDCSPRPRTRWTLKTAESLKTAERKPTDPASASWLPAWWMPTGGCTPEEVICNPRVPEAKCPPNRARHLVPVTVHPDTMYI